MKVRTRLLTSAFAASLLASGAAMAQSAPVYYEYAPVVGYEPIRAAHRIPVEREVCWQERGYRQHGGGSATGTIAGAIIGGVIGNQFGGGSGRKALTVGGAALGASVGHDATRRNRHAHPVSYERCEIQVDYEYREHVSGYRVRYEYNGELFETRTSHPPGESIRLQVSARPVH